MKLFTLNTHSLVEEGYAGKRESFVKGILQLQPDLMALQEVNQSRCEREIAVPEKGMVLGDVPLRSDNHAFRVAEELEAQGLSYHWIWVPIKVGYDRYDEGLAIFSRNPIEQWETVRISESDSYYNFRTRYVLGACVGGIWYYSVHTGRWQDGEEQFIRQWSRLTGHVEGKEKVWLLGDFNSPAEEPGTGYDRMRKSGWYDSFLMARRRGAGMTVPREIDGWRDKARDAMRIDYIWSNYPADILCSETFFDGKNGVVVSDHYGILVETAP